MSVWKVSPVFFLGMVSCFLVCRFVAWQQGKSVYTGAQASPSHGSPTLVLLWILDGHVPTSDCAATSPCAHPFRDAESHSDTTDNDLVLVNQNSPKGRGPWYPQSWNQPILATAGGLQDTRRPPGRD